MAKKPLTLEELHKKRVHDMSDQNFRLCVDTIIKAACSCSTYVGITKCPGCHGNRFFWYLGEAGVMACCESAVCEFHFPVFGTIIAKKIKLMADKNKKKK